MSSTYQLQFTLITSQFVMPAKNSHNFKPLHQFSSPPLFKPLFFVSLSLTFTLGKKETKPNSSLVSASLSIETSGERKQLTGGACVHDSSVQLASSFSLPFVRGSQQQKWQRNLFSDPLTQSARKLAFLWTDLEEKSCWFFNQNPWQFQACSIFFFQSLSCIRLN